jgi:prevent-host-death family protein
MAAEVASRELRNNTAGLLRRVEAGESVVITLRGKPVADLVPHAASRRRRFLTPSEVMAIRRSSEADPTFWADIQKMRSETTDDLGPI